MTIAEARTMVRQFARNAGSSDMYTEADVDRALQIVGEQFCRNTRFLRATASVSLSDGTATFSASNITNFRAERIIDIRLTNVAEALSVVPYSELHRHSTEDTGEGAPEEVAFLTTTDGKVWPTPGSNYTMIMLYWQPFTTWTPGTGDTSTLETDVNLPDDVMLQICSTGAPARMQHMEPEQLYAAPAWKEYLRVEASFRGGGNLGAKVIDRRRDDQQQSGHRTFWLSEL